jgi:hypothetical protein
MPAAAATSVPLVQHWRWQQHKQQQLCGRLWQQLPSPNMQMQLLLLLLVRLLLLLAAMEQQRCCCVASMYGQVVRPACCCRQEWLALHHYQRPKQFL